MSWFKIFSKKEKSNFEQICDLLEVYENLINEAKKDQTNHPIHAHFINIYHSFTNFVKMIYENEKILSEGNNVNIFEYIRMATSLYQKFLDFNLNVVDQSILDECEQTITLLKEKTDKLGPVTNTSQNYGEELSTEAQIIKEALKEID